MRGGRLNSSSCRKVKGKKRLECRVSNSQVGEIRLCREQHQHFSTGYPVKFTLNSKEINSNDVFFTLDLRSAGIPSATDMQYIICALPLRFAAGRRKNGRGLGRGFRFAPPTSMFLLPLRGSNPGDYVSIPNRPRRANIRCPRRAPAKPGDKATSKFHPPRRGRTKKISLSKRRYIHRISVTEALRSAAVSLEDNNVMTGGR